MNYTALFEKIKMMCRRGSARDIDEVISMLNEDVELPTTKAIDFYLGQVDSAEGIKRIEYHLFEGTQMQRNYCTLYFARKNQWALVNRAYEMGLVDWAQAYSR